MNLQSKRTLAGVVLMGNLMNAAACDTKMATPCIGTKIEQLFEQPLITGASVSADYGTASPGKRAALRFTLPTKITTLAQAGTPGRITALRLDQSALKGHSLIIAMDLFFWDSTLPNPEESLKALESVIHRARSLDVPILLGDIPELLPGRQPAREVLNASIHALCLKERGCYVWELGKPHRQVIQDGYLTIAGRNYTMRELVPDGLHLSELASEFLADGLIGVLRGSNGMTIAPNS